MDVFDRCASLTSINIPESVTKIGWYAFYGCKSLTSITIPNSMTKIGWYAFAGCSNLREIIIPEGVKIAEGVFENCPNLKITWVKANSEENDENEERE